MSCSFGSGACSTAAAIASSSCSCAPHRWMERLKERVEGGEEGGEDGSIGGGGGGVCAQGTSYSRDTHFCAFQHRISQAPSTNTSCALFSRFYIDRKNRIQRKRPASLFPFQILSVSVRSNTPDISFLCALLTPRA